MRYLVNAVIAILLGYWITLLFYMIGEPLTSPLLFLARQLSSDRGGDSLLPAWTIFNTLICATIIYAMVLCVKPVVTRLMRRFEIIIATLQSHG